jgi:hypothetical protein
MSEVKVNADLLYAFAQLHDAIQFDKKELRCRIVQAETDEGYPTQGEVLQIYADPTDPSWHQHMISTYGPGPHIIRIHEVPWNREPGVRGWHNVSAQVEVYLRQRLQSKRQAHLDHGAELDRLLSPLGI